MHLLQLHGQSVWRALAAVLQREGLRGVYGSVKAAAARAGRVLPSVPVMPVSSCLPTGAWPPDAHFSWRLTSYMCASPCSSWLPRMLQQVIAKLLLAGLPVHGVCCSAGAHVFGLDLGDWHCRAALICQSDCLALCGGYRAAN